MNSAKYAPVIPVSINVTYGGNSEDNTWDQDEYTVTELTEADIDCTDDFWSDACTQDYCDKQDSVTRQAGIMMAVPFIVTVCTIFIFGKVGVDRLGLRPHMLVFGPLLYVIAHGMFTLVYSFAWLPLLLLGIGWSIYVASIWPSIPLVVPPQLVGRAFGLMTCIQAVGNAISPLVVSFIYSNSGQQYVPGVEIYFLSCSITVVLIGITLVRIDQNQAPQSTDTNTAEL
jgi:MFS family permease